MVKKLTLLSLILVLTTTIDLWTSLANAAPFNLTTIPFDEGFSPLFGDGNLVRSPNRKGVRLLLDKYTGSGFISSSLYDHGFFSARIKLPSENTAGICVAFYTSNADVFEKSHDELDIEFLGNTAGKPWRFQTNMYGNGSTSRGREERYRLSFDPTKDFHRYSILWTPKNIIFYVDEVPIRQVVRKAAMGGDYPSKPMSLYATIWDASNWATNGGKVKTNYDYAPFVTEFRDLVLDGCPSDPIEQFPFESCDEKLTHIAAQEYSTVNGARWASMRRFRQRYMYYSHCYDELRYPVAMPECEVSPTEKARFKNTGRLKFGGSHKKQPKISKRRRGNRSAVNSGNKVDM